MPPVLSNKINTLSNTHDITSNGRKHQKAQWLLRGSGGKEEGGGIAGVQGM